MRYRQNTKGDILYGSPVNVTLFCKEMKRNKEILHNGSTSKEICMN